MIKKISIIGTLIILFLFITAGDIFAQCGCLFDAAQGDSFCTAGCSNANTPCTLPQGSECQAPGTLPPGSGGIYSYIAAMSLPKFGTRTIGFLVEQFLPYFYTIAGILLLLFLIYGGISLMTAQGDPKKVMAAKEMITGALVGFIIVFTSFWIVQVVGYVLNIPALRNIFG